jgi:hypothetical protein
MSRIPPERSPDGRKNYGWILQYRPRRSMLWRRATVWAPTQEEAITELRHWKGPLALHVECLTKEPKELRKVIEVTGRIIEAGCNAQGQNEIVLEAVGHEQRITVAGVSDALVKRAAANLYRPVWLEIKPVEP